MNNNLGLCEVSRRIAFSAVFFGIWDRTGVVGVGVVLLPLNAAPNSETIH